MLGKCFRFGLVQCIREVEYKLVGDLKPIEEL